LLNEAAILSSCWLTKDDKKSEMISQVMGQPCAQAHIPKGSHSVRSAVAVPVGLSPPVTPEEARSFCSLTFYGVFMI